ILVGDSRPAAAPAGAGHGRRTPRRRAPARTDRGPRPAQGRLAAPLRAAHSADPARPRRGRATGRPAGSPGAADPLPRGGPAALPPGPVPGTPLLSPRAGRGGRHDPAPAAGAAQTTTLAGAGCRPPPGWPVGAARDRPSRVAWPPSTGRGPAAS